MFEDDIIKSVIEAKKEIKAELAPKKPLLKEQAIEAYIQTKQATKEGINYIKTNTPSKVTVLKYTGVTFVIDLISSLKKDTFDNHEKKEVKEKRKVFKKYGPPAQVVKFIEETSELNKELCKILDGNPVPEEKTKNIHKVISDVIITLESLKLAVGYKEEDLTDVLTEVTKEHL